MSQKQGPHRVVNSAQILETALRERLAPRGHDIQSTGRLVTRNLSTCRCGHPANLMSSHASRDRYLVCSACAATPLRLPFTGQLAAARFRCPLCQWETIKTTNQQGGAHHICPFCFTNAPPATGCPDLQEVRCFQCRNRSCPMAGGR